MIKYKVTSTHPNPAYLPKVTWVDTQEEADALEAKEDLAVTKIEKHEVPDGVYEMIKNRLEDSKQFREMSEGEQFEDIYLCYCRLTWEMDAFYDSRYAY